MNWVLISAEDMHRFLEMVIIPVMLCTFKVSFKIMKLKKKFFRVISQLFLLFVFCLKYLFNYPHQIFSHIGTDVNRTLMSAAANMAGLFPPKDNQVWKKGFMWQPVPIHSIPQKMDHILYAGKKCERYNQAMTEYLQSTEHTDLLAKYKNLFTYLEENSGREVRSFEDVEMLYNTLWIENLKNKG